MSLTVDIRKRLEHFELQTRFTCPAGSLTAVVGPSGAGKTTLIRIIAGLEKPDCGTITVNGGVVADAEQGVFTPPWKRKTGLVFQEYTLFPHLTVEQNILFGAEAPDKAGPLMELFGIARLGGRRPSEISGGERQRTAFCQALARDPELLLLDEPFSALDAATRDFLCGLLAEYKRELGVPILHVTHDLEEAARLGDNVIAVDEGRIAPEWFDLATARRPVPPQAAYACA